MIYLTKILQVTKDRKKTTVKTRTIKMCKHESINEAELDETTGCRVTRDVGREGQVVD